MTETPQHNIKALLDRLHPVRDDVSVDSDHARHAVPPELPVSSPEHHPVSTTARPPLNERYQSPPDVDDLKPAASGLVDGTGRRTTIVRNPTASASLNCGTASG